MQRLFVLIPPREAMISACRFLWSCMFGLRALKGPFSVLAILPATCDFFFPEMTSSKNCQSLARTSTFDVQLSLTVLRPTRSMRVMCLLSHQRVRWFVVIQAYPPWFSTNENVPITLNPAHLSRQRNNPEGRKKIVLTFVNICTLITMLHAWM